MFRPPAVRTRTARDNETAGPPRSHVTSADLDSPPRQGTDSPSHHGVAEGAIADEASLVFCAYHLLRNFAGVQRQVFSRDVNVSLPQELAK